MEPVTQPEQVAPVAKSVWPSAYSILKQSIVFYKKHAKAFFLIGLVPFAFSLVASLISLLLVGATAQVAIVVGVLLVLIGIASMVFSVANQVAVVKAVDSLDKGEAVGVKALYKVGFNLFFPVIWIGILTALVVWGGLVALIIPAFVLGIYLSFAQYNLILENKRGMGALATSMAYIKGNGWQIFRKSFYLGLAGFAVSIIIWAVAAALSALISGDGGSIFTVLAQNAPITFPKVAYQIFADLVTYAVLIPIVFAYYYFIYKHVLSLRAGVAVTEAETLRNRKILFIWSMVGLVAIVLAIVFFILSFSRQF